MLGIPLKLSTLLRIFPQIIKWAFLKNEKKYTYMQQIAYQHAAKQSSYDSEKKDDHVVGSGTGSYEEHNKWKDYDTYLMKYVDESFTNKVALDFGCGPGRNLVKYSKSFQRIDGCDISKENIKNAKKNLEFNKIPVPNLYVTNGNDLGDVPDNYYDYIFSSIVLQHICVHKIRFSILSSMYKALKEGGRISLQMGFGENSPNTVGYYENFYNAIGTNRAVDTRVDDPNEIKKDLEKIGFKNFEYWIREVGPGDNHPNWIFFTAVK